MTRRGVVIPFPREQVVRDWEVVELGRHRYRLRPGSWAQRIWHFITVPEQ